MKWNKEIKAEEEQIIIGVVNDVVNITINKIETMIESELDGRLPNSFTQEDYDNHKEKIHSKIAQLLID